MEQFDKYVCVGDTIEWTQDGFTVTAKIEHDPFTGAPWEEHDGHGNVTGWEHRAKLPGEMVLCEDRGLRRFYDFQGACKIARRLGVFSPCPIRHAAQAAMRDFRVLKAWCDDEWFWCGVVVTVSRNGIELATESLWGIECNYPDSDNSYLGDVARELATEAMETARDAIAALTEQR
ncbi:hypothetical protein QO034_13310 [Sedimentitalea sp. JM2-8]|uniref:Uncharacterized protein n=1 Tax=Sedimentitalea xiamensis TaxID=3050037 RepID=A0ABT7FG29_9RHOB|nr:hypothetical protein [Sedimentitalea xiamensis]MDK3074094.1 hypothetical protein [Sedimentitalea xiamensis]